MAHDGLGVGVGVMRIGIPDALLHEVAVAALAHVLQIAPRQITAQLVTILAGNTTATVTVTVNDDAVVEDNETFTATISAPKFNGVTDATRVVLGDASATATIENNDMVCEARHFIG